jgi:hypothetical protein
MNVVGETKPRVGCRDRARASNEVTSPVRVSMMGW